MQSLASSLLPCVTSNNLKITSGFFKWLTAPAKSKFAEPQYCLLSWWRSSNLGLTPAAAGVSAHQAGAHTQCRTGGTPPLAHRALSGAVCTMEDAQQHLLPETSPGAGTGLPYPTIGPRWCSAQVQKQSLICITEWALSKYLQRALCRRLVPAMQRSSTFLVFFYWFRLFDLWNSCSFHSNLKMVSRNIGFCCVG